MEFGTGKAIARRVAQELKAGWAVNLGFGVFGQCADAYCWKKASTGKTTWVIEQGAVGGIPLLDFQFGCSSNAEAIVASTVPVHLLSGRRI
jgi:acyl CoA:acetate/3-ketoacid CoA transferase